MYSHNDVNTSNRTGSSPSVQQAVDASQSRRENRQRSTKSNTKLIMYVNVENISLLEEIIINYF